MNLIAPEDWEQIALWLIRAVVLAILVVGGSAIAGLAVGVFITAKGFP